MALVLSNSAVQSITASSQQFSLTLSESVQYQITSTAPCWLAIGSNPTAAARTTGSTYLPPNYPTLLLALAGQTKLAVIQDSGGAQPSIEPEFEVSIPATAGAVTIYTGAGVLISVVCTTGGSAALSFQDAAGAIIASIPSTATVGQIFSLNVPFGTSLVANKSTTTPVVTAAYAQAVGFASVCEYR